MVGFGFLRPFIKSAIKEGVSARKTLEAFRKNGLQIRDSTFFKYYKAVKEEQVKGFNIRFARDDAKLTARYYAKSQRLDNKRYVEFIVRFAGRTGRVGEAPLTVKHEGILTKRELYDRANEIVEENLAGFRDSLPYDTDVESWTVEPISAWEGLLA